jgi:hypothetical protein
VQPTTMRPKVMQACSVPRRWNPRVQISRCGLGKV